MKNALIVLLLPLLTLTSCSKEKSASSSASSMCPSSLAASSHLPLAPTPMSAVPLHANGINTTWNWQLKETLNTSYNTDVYDIDLFDTSSSTISALKTSGKKVVCYFSAGSSENWRSDYDQFSSNDMGKTLDGWEGERWLDIRSQNVFDIMKARIDLAAAKGCEGVEPDNMDGFIQDSCFDLTADHQLAYNRAIANYARSKGLSVALKNDPDQVASLENYFDFAVTEECYFYSECASYLPFIAASKPVFNAEYETKYRSNPDQASLCNYSNTEGIQTIIFDIELNDSYRFQCF